MSTGWIAFCIIMSYILLLCWVVYEYNKYKNRKIMTKQLKEIEIPFGAKDSELCGWEYTIPEGMEATMIGNKIVVKKKESEDESIINEIIKLVMQPTWKTEKEFQRRKELRAWIEKQGEKKPINKVEPFDKYEELTDFERTLADICTGWIGQEIGWKQYIKDSADALLKITMKTKNNK